MDNELWLCLYFIYLRTDDMAEQQQTREQARLLQRYNALREWQAEQQQRLVLQQQQQLDLLKTEQQRMQKLMTLQRQQAWGGSAQPSGTNL